MKVTMLGRCGAVQCSAVGERTEGSFLLNVRSDFSGGVIFLNPHLLGGRRWCTSAVEQLALPMASSICACHCHDAEPSSIARSTKEGTSTTSSGLNCLRDGDGGARGANGGADPLCPLL